MRTACSSTTTPTAYSTVSPHGAPPRPRARGCGSMKRSALLAALTLGARAAVGAPPPSPPLLDGLGTHHFPVTCSTKAQAYVDQGMAMVYGFNHDEAIRAFEEAARLDPRCAMAFWGKALA